jgi:hypothetical protein
MTTSELLLAEWMPHKFVPELGERGFDSLPHLRQQELSFRRIGPCHDQHVGFLGPLRRSLLTAIAEITERDAAVDTVQERQHRNAVVPVAGRQDQIHNASVNVTQNVELETEKPALAGFAPIRAFFAQQAHPPVAEGMADRNRFGIDQVKGRSPRREIGRGPQQGFEQGGQGMHPRDPLRIRAQTRKSSTIVGRDQAVGLFQTGHFQPTLQQRDGQHFGIGKGRMLVRGVPPIR